MPLIQLEPTFTLYKTKKSCHSKHHSFELSERGSLLGHRFVDIIHSMNHTQIYNHTRVIKKTRQKYLHCGNIFPWETVGGIRYEHTRLAHRAVTDDNTFDRSALGHGFYGNDSALNLEGEE